MGNRLREGCKLRYIGRNELFGLQPGDIITDYKINDNFVEYLRYILLPDYFEIVEDDNALTKGDLYGNSFESLITFTNKKHKRKSFFRHKYI